MRRDPFYIFWSECRRHGPAAIGATETIHFFPYFFFDMYSEILKTFWLILFQFAEKTAEPAFTVTDPLPEGTEINGLYQMHAAKITIQ